MKIQQWLYKIPVIQGRTVTLRPFPSLQPGFPGSVVVPVSCPCVPTPCSTCSSKETALGIPGYPKREGTHRDPGAQLPDPSKSHPVPAEHHSHWAEPNPWVPTGRSDFMEFFHPPETAAPGSRAVWEVFAADRAGPGQCSLTCFLSSGLSRRYRGSNTILCSSFSHVENADTWGHRQRRHRVLVRVGKEPMVRGEATEELRELRNAGQDSRGG